MAFHAAISNLARDGAEPLIWFAEGYPGRDWEPGEYYEKRKLATANPEADDSARRAQLWERGTRLGGLPDPGQAVR